MQRTVTLLVLASEEKARLLEINSLDKVLEEIECVDRSPVDDEGKEFSDRAGRMAVGGEARHAFEPRTLVADRLRQEFAGKVVAAMSERLAAAPFDRLVVAAGPKMLGLLRTALSPELRRRLVFDLDKELIDLPVADLTRHIGAGLAR